MTNGIRSHTVTPPFLRPPESGVIGETMPAFDPAVVDERLAWEECREAGATPAPGWDASRDLGALFRRADLVETLLDDLAPALETSVPSVPGFAFHTHLGVGGMGEVWLGEDRVLGRQVAVKLPLRRLAPGQLAARFEREGRALGRLKHRNIVGVHSAGVAAGRPYLVMDFVPGGSLEDCIDDLPSDPGRAAALVAAAADGVDHAHRAGVFHRDLKPANLLLDPTDLVRVSDFGIAAILAEPDPAEIAGQPSAETVSDVARLTRTDSLVGTPAYSAPEIHRAPTAPPRPESDVWSLGVILYRAVTGGLPFDGRPLAVRDAVLTADPPAPCAVNPHVPAWLDAVIRRCLAKNPEARFRTAGELAAALRAGPVAARRRRRLRERVTLALAGVAASAALVLAALPEDPGRRHDRVSARIAADLAKAKAVDLVPEGKLPHTYKPVVNPDLLTVKHTADGVLFDAHGPVFVEFLAETPKEGYRLEVSLRQTFGNGNGEDAGIYACGTAGPDGTNDFVVLRFSDLGELATAFPLPGGGAGAGAQLRFIRTLHVPPRLAAVTAKWWDGMQLGPYVPDEHLRSVTLDVRGDDVAATLDGGPILVLSRDRVRARHFPRDGRPVNLSATGGVGLYLAHCGVLVRHCRLTPSELQK